VPKPRQVQSTPKAEDNQPKTIQTPSIVVEPQASPNTKPKESIRNSVKESLASLFGSNNKHGIRKFHTLSDFYIKNKD
jgi:hypothetical protein